MLPDRIEYTGEYGAELGVFVPFVHFLKKSGILKQSKIISYSGMRPYYFFLDDSEYEEKNNSRVHIACFNRHFLPEHLRNDDNIFDKGETIENFLPPNYNDFFNDVIKTPLPLLIVQNKFNSEWGDNPKNFLNLQELNYLFTELQDIYNIVYIRTNEFRGTGYSHDHNEDMSFKIEDKETISSKFPKVVLIENLMFQYPNITFNTLKCLLQSSAKVTISTIGGYNFFDAYFPSKHLIYKKDAPELYSKNFYQNQHDLLCPGRSSEILFAKNENEFNECIKQLKVYSFNK